MEETNAWQAVRNNAYGTWVLARAAVAAKVEKFVLVSTDKAVNPTSVMGASKRLAEIVCQSLQGAATQFVLVRFGNVFGSAGSVIPRFQEQIARGGPVTVTHPEITRYFMSLLEATQLLLQAGLQGRGGEILVLDMGEPVRIVDLARDMIRLSGADPDQIAVVFTGLRPGEKLYEELLASEEATLPTPHPKLRIAQARAANLDSVGQMIAWCERDRIADDAEVRARLKAWIPEYAPPAGAPVKPIPAEARVRRGSEGAAAAARAAQALMRDARADALFEHARLARVELGHRDAVHRLDPLDRLAARALDVGRVAHAPREAPPRDAVTVADARSATGPDPGRRTPGPSLREVVVQRRAGVVIDVVRLHAEMRPAQPGETRRSASRRSRGTRKRRYRSRASARQLRDLVAGDAVAKARPGIERRAASARPSSSTHGIHIRGA